MRAAIGLVCLGLAFGATAAKADVIFSDNFNNYTAAAGPLSQFGTGLNVYYNGVLSNFAGSGGNANLAVDRTGRGDYAVMLYGGATGMAQDPSSYNAITLITPIAANVDGVAYTVSFDSAPAVFTDGPQRTRAGDYLVFQFLDGNGGNFANFSIGMLDFTATSDNPSNPFTTNTFTYTGNGVGNMNVNIFAVTAADQFGGAIDNLVISSPNAPAVVPEPASMALIGLGLLGAGMVRRHRQTAV